MRSVVCSSLLLLVSLATSPSVLAEPPSRDVLPAIELPADDAFRKPSAKEINLIGEWISDLELTLEEMDRFSSRAQCEKMGLSPGKKAPRLVASQHNVTTAVNRKMQAKLLKVSWQPLLAGESEIGGVSDRSVSFSKIEKKDETWGGLSDSMQLLKGKDILTFDDRLRRAGFFDPIRATMSSGSEILYGSAMSMHNHAFVKRDNLKLISKEKDLTHTLWRFGNPGILTRYVTFRDKRIVQCEDRLTSGPDPNKKPLYGRTRTAWSKIRGDSGEMVMLPSQIHTKVVQQGNAIELFGSIEWQFGDAVDDSLFKPAQDFKTMFGGQIPQEILSR